MSYYGEEHELKDVKKYSELFVDDKILKNMLQKRDEYGFADSIQIGKAKNITESNWKDYVKYLIANGENWGRATSQFFDNELSFPRYCYEDDRKYQYVINEMEYENLDTIKDIINRCIYANNYAIIANKLGEIWSFEWGKHSGVEVVDDLADDIDGDGDIKKLFKSYDKWKPSKEFIEEAKQLGIKALEEIMEENNGIIDYEQVENDQWTNPWYYSLVFEDEKLFEKYYPLLDDYGKDIFKEKIITKFIKENN